jgi:hypothetical protein
VKDIRHDIVERTLKLAGNTDLDQTAANLLKENAAALVERGHFFEALNEADEALLKILQKQGQPTRDELISLRTTLCKGWQFRQYQCPKCGGFAGFIFMFCDPGPNRVIWDCEQCGMTRQSDGAD